MGMDLTPVKPDLLYPGVIPEPEPTEAEIDQMVLEEMRDLLLTDEDGHVTTFKKSITPETARQLVSERIRRDRDGTPWSLSLNWRAWEELIQTLECWEVNVSEFKRLNDGDLISAETCAAVAAAIERHLDTLFKPGEREFLEKQLPYWQYSGGFRQF